MGVLPGSHKQGVHREGKGHWPWVGKAVPRVEDKVARLAGDKAAQLAGDMAAQLVGDKAD